MTRAWSQAWSRVPGGTFTLPGSSLGSGEVPGPGWRQMNPGPTRVAPSIPGRPFSSFIPAPQARLVGRLRPRQVRWPSRVPELARSPGRPPRPGALAPRSAPLAVVSVDGRASLCLRLPTFVCSVMGTSLGPSGVSLCWVWVTDEPPRRRRWTAPRRRHTGRPEV